MSEPAKKDVVIDTLVLAFSRSNLKHVVGTDALRSVLDIQYRDMLRGTELILEPLWSLLAEQPGFDEEAAKPPVARIKRLEAQLKLTVVLPEAMTGLAEVDLILLAGSCEVSEADVEKISRQHDPTAHADREAKRRDAEAVADGADRLEARATNRLPVIALAAVIALGAFGFTGWQIYRSIAGPSPHFDPLQVDLPGLPVASAKRRGAEAVVRLSDDAWFIRTPVTERETTLESALQQAAPSGIEVLIVMNKAGAVKATAQFYRDRGQRLIRVRFQ